MLQRKYGLIMLAALIWVGQSCTENYSNGERIGVVTQFSKSGVIWKSHEGHLNVTQTGMNSSVPFDFSIDNDNEPAHVVRTIDSAAQYGWKVKLVYHETAGKNFFSNRGETNHFIEKCEVLEKNFGNVFNGKTHNDNGRQGRIVDTIYVVIDKTKK